MNTPLSKWTRSLLASVPILGLSAGAIVFATPTAVAQPTPINVSLSWYHYLNDAPCGVALSSPTEFTEAGVPSVEFGDREGDAYAFGLQDGGASPGWASLASSVGIGSGQGCAHNNTGGGDPKTTNA